MTFPSTTEQLALNLLSFDLGPSSRSVLHDLAGRPTHPTPRPKLPSQGGKGETIARQRALSGKDPLGPAEALDMLDGSVESWGTTKLGNVTAAAVLKVLENPDVRLTDDAIVALLRKGADYVTASWLWGATGYTPTLAMVRELSDDPGSSHRLEWWDHQLDEDDEEEDVPPFFGPLEYWISASFEHPCLAAVPGASRALLNHAPHLVLDYAAEDPSQCDEPGRPPWPYAEYLVDEVTARFGDNGNAWALVLQVGFEFPASTLDGLFDSIEAALT